MKAFGDMLQVARILNTASGAPIQWPTVDDTHQQWSLAFRSLRDEPDEPGPRSGKPHQQFGGNEAGVNDCCTR